jgi:hypothetical protein
VRFFGNKILILLVQNGEENQRLLDIMHYLLLLNLFVKINDTIKVDFLEKQMKEMIRRHFGVV